MIEPSRPEDRGRGRGGRFRYGGLAGLGLVLLLGLLPALVAGLRVNDAPAPGEIARLRRAVAVLDRSVAAGEAVASRPAALYLTATLGDARADIREPGVAVVTDAERAALGLARRVQLVTVALLGLMLYLVVGMARGRFRGVFASVALVTTGPVALGGHILRVETLTALAGLACVLNLQLLARALAPRGRLREGHGGLRPVPATRRARWRQSADLLAPGVLAALTAGLTVALQPARAAPLMLPAGVLLVATVLASRGFLRALRRRILLIPGRGWSRRLLPWTAVSLGALGAGALLLQGVDDGLARPAPATADLVPWSWWLAGGEWALALLGAGSLVWVVGQRLGRRNRVTPGSVLAVFLVLFLGDALARGGDRDLLPAACALAAVLGDGVGSLLAAWIRRSAARFRGLRGAAVPGS